MGAAKKSRTPRTNAPEHLVPARPGEMEHAAMPSDWIRRRDTAIDEELRVSGFVAKLESEHLRRGSPRRALPTDGALRRPARIGRCRMTDSLKRRSRNRGMETREAERDFRASMECSMEMERRGRAERRRDASPGYMWISTVGWICRREKGRRDEDPDPTEC